MMKRNYNHIDFLSNHLDSKDSDSVLSLLTEDCLFVAGNNEPITGKEAIKVILENFFAAVKSTKHEVTDIFESKNSLVHRGKVTYTRLDNSQLIVPFCDVFKMKGNLISAYYIYIDWSELFK
ncbi:nuclear transport factor 2 family protein [Winogradskyella sp.]|uniref:nuclear transport factor 2 family protein n=1 Tax=Winogradskyella sp. TaxID=1883156 RepID=UPI0025E2A71A|nr:nuclear transport factor 2 family protein [Winogradskyella sp.]MCT4630669.1 nuclear transport factor 2 family protein [Winogradskyella sp.]